MKRAVWLAVGSLALALLTVPTFYGFWWVLVFPVSGLIILMKRKVAAETLFEVFFWALIWLGFLAPLVAPFSADAQLSGHHFHLFGSDELGRDILSRLLFAVRHSVLIGLGSAGLAAVFACVFAALRISLPEFLGRGLDVGLQVFLSLPLLMLYFIALALLKPGPGTLVLIMGTTLWPEGARLLYQRIQALNIQPFAQVARMQGLSETRVFVREILPNLRSLLAANFILNFLNAVLLESILSYLGLGMGIGKPSLGGFLQASAQQWDRRPGLLLLSLLILAVFLVPMQRYGFRPMGRRKGLRLDQSTTE